MITNVLIGYNASEQAERAFDLALDIAAKYQAKLIVFSVVQIPEPPEDIETEAILEASTESYQQRFNSLKDRSSSAGIIPKFEVRVGHPADQILGMADEENADLIVLGHKSKSFIQRWMQGSVSKRVLTYARCPVLITR